VGFVDRNGQSELATGEMKIDSDKFRVNPGKAIKLSKLPTNIKPLCDTKEKYQSVLTQHVSDLSDLQHLHYASNRYAPC
jgi:hypothetical protein